MQKLLHIPLQAQFTILVYAYQRDDAVPHISEDHATHFIGLDSRMMYSTNKNPFHISNLFKIPLRQHEIASSEDNING